MYKHQRIFGYGLLAMSGIFTYMASVLYTWEPLYTSYEIGFSPNINIYYIGFAIFGGMFLLFGFFLVNKKPIRSTKTEIFILLTFVCGLGVFIILVGNIDNPTSSEFVPQYFLFLLSSLMAVGFSSLILALGNHEIVSRIIRTIDLNDDIFKNYLIKSTKNHLNVFLILAITFLVMYFTLSFLFVIVSWFFFIIIIVMLYKIKQDMWDLPKYRILLFDILSVSTYELYFTILLAAYILIGIISFFWGFSHDDYGFTFFLSVPSFLVFIASFIYIINSMKKSRVGPLPVMMEVPVLIQQSGIAPPSRHLRNFVNALSAIFTAIILALALINTGSILNTLAQMNDIDVNNSATPLEALSYFQEYSARGEYYKAEDFCIGSIDYDYAEFMGKYDGWPERYVYRVFKSEQVVYSENMTSYEDSKISQMIEEIQTNEQVSISNSCLILYKLEVNDWNFTLGISDIFIDTYACFEINNRWFISTYTGFENITLNGEIASLKQTNYRELTITFGNFTPEPRLHELSLVIKGDNNNITYNPMMRLNVDNYTELSINGFVGKYDVWPYGNYTVTLLHLPTNREFSLSGQTNISINKWWNLP